MSHVPKMGPEGWTVSLGTWLVNAYVPADLATVLEYYQSLSPRRLVILGEPGAGKTVLAMELLIALLELRQHDADVPVPILVSAAAYDSSQPWEHLARRAPERSIQHDGPRNGHLQGMARIRPRGFNRAVSARPV